MAGDAAGEAAGDEIGLAGAMIGVADWIAGLGPAAGLLMFSTFGSQAPNTAAETAKAETNISLLIFLEAVISCGLVT